MRSTTASIVCLRLGSSFGQRHPSRGCGHRSARARSPAPRGLRASARARPCDHSTAARAGDGRAFGQPQHLVDHLAHRLGGEVDQMIGAARRARARKQQPQIVVDLGDRADRRARIVRGRLLLDGDRGREALDADRHPACPSSRGTAARTRTATRRSAAAPRRTAYRMRATTCRSPTSPVSTISRSRGRSTSMLFRL